MAWIWYGPPTGRRLGSLTQVASSDAGWAIRLSALSCGTIASVGGVPEALGDRDDLALDLVVLLDREVGLVLRVLLDELDLVLARDAALGVDRLEADLVARGQRLADDGHRARQRREHAELDGGPVEAGVLGGAPPASAASPPPPPPAGSSSVSAPPQPAAPSAAHAASAATSVLRM
jgi:hypothetical protein